MNKTIGQAIWDNLKALQNFQVEMARSEVGQWVDEEEEEMSEEEYIEQERGSHLHKI